MKFYRIFTLLYFFYGTHSLADGEIELLRNMDDGTELVNVTCKTGLEFCSVTLSQDSVLLEKSRMKKSHVEKAIFLFLSAVGQGQEALSDPFAEWNISGFTNDKVRSGSISSSDFMHPADSRKSAVKKAFKNLERELSSESGEIF
jgi:hypothetical protein